MTSCCNAIAGPAKDIAVANICAGNTVTNTLSVCRNAQIGGVLTVGALASAATGAPFVFSVTRVPPTPGLTSPAGGINVSDGTTTTLIPFPASTVARSTGQVIGATLTDFLALITNSLAIADGSAITILPVLGSPLNNTIRNGYAFTAPTNVTVLNLWATLTIQLTVLTPAFQILVTVRTSPPSTGSPPAEYTSSALTVTIPIPAGATLLAPFAYEQNLANLINSLSVPAGTKILLEATHNAPPGTIIGAQGFTLSAGYVAA